MECESQIHVSGSWDVAINVYKYIHVSVRWSGFRVRARVRAGASYP